MEIIKIDGESYSLSIERFNNCLCLKNIKEISEKFSFEKGEVNSSREILPLEFSSDRLPGDFSFYHDFVNNRIFEKDEHLIEAILVADYLMDYQVIKKIALFLYEKDKIFYWEFIDGLPENHSLRGIIYPIRREMDSWQIVYLVDDPFCFTQNMRNCIKHISVENAIIHNSMTILKIIDTHYSESNYNRLIRDGRLNLIIYLNERGLFNEISSWEYISEILYDDDINIFRYCHNKFRLDLTRCLNNSRDDIFRYILQCATREEIFKSNTLRRFFQEGKYDNFKLLVEAGANIRDNNLIREAISAGFPEYIDILLDNGFQIEELKEFINDASRPDMLVYFSKKGISISQNIPSLFYNSLSGYSLDLVKYIVEEMGISEKGGGKERKGNEFIKYKIPPHINFLSLEYILSHKIKISNLLEVLHYNIKYPKNEKNIEILLNLSISGRKNKKCHMEDASKNGYLSFLKRYCLSKKFKEYYNDFFRIAFENLNFDICDFFIENGVDINKVIETEKKLYKNSLQKMKYLLQKDIKNMSFFNDIFYNLISEKDISSVRILIEKGIFICKNCFNLAQSNKFPSKIIKMMEKSMKDQEIKKKIIDFKKGLISSLDYEIEQRNFHNK